MILPNCVCILGSVMLHVTLKKMHGKPNLMIEGAMVSSGGLARHSVSWPACKRHLRARGMVATPPGEEAVGELVTRSPGGSGIHLH